MTEKEFNKKMGQRIKDLRKEKGMSQIELAVELDYEKSNMSRLESGRVHPKIFTLYKVAKALDIELTELLNFQ